MSETLGISPKPPETVLPEVDASLLAKLVESIESNDLNSVELLTAENPTNLFCWATLAVMSESVITKYAYARIGYHRGLDSLRANGWRGSGYVRSNTASNRGFLTCLALLHHYAGEIGEDSEFERCKEFLIQLDPGLNWNEFDYDNVIDFLFNKS